MRLKNVPGSREVIEKSPWVITEPERYRGRWQTLFHTVRPLWIEIGMGKGQFLMGMAAAHPEVNFLGLEKYSSVLVRAVQKQEEEKHPNLMLVRADAEYLPDYFAPQEADRIFLNFSDPWPKDRHAKRRLTSDRFLERYDVILASEGQVEFKTDNKGLFDYSLAAAEECGWEITAVTGDLHHSAMAEGNIMTEYEEKFSAAGNPICKMIIRRRRRGGTAGQTDICMSANLTRCSPRCDSKKHQRTALDG